MISFLSAEVSSEILKKSEYMNTILGLNDSNGFHYEILKRQKNGKSNYLNHSNPLNYSNLKYNAESTLSFTNIEISTLKWYIRKIELFLLKFNCKLLTFNFNIGKLESGFDWDFPFTVGNTIFFTGSIKLLE